MARRLVPQLRELQNGCRDDLLDGSVPWLHRRRVVPAVRGQLCPPLHADSGRLVSRDCCSWYVLGSRSVALHARTDPSFLVLCAGVTVWKAIKEVSRELPSLPGPFLTLPFTGELQARRLDDYLGSRGRIG